MPSTKSRMADDRLASCLSALMKSIKTDTGTRRPAAISFNPFQNASSRLTLVWRPATVIARLVIKDFMFAPPPALPKSRGKAPAALGACRGRPRGCQGGAKSTEGEQTVAAKN